ncbi:hypothetical protein ACFSL4_33285 [Streptomyces caeni]|uniref:PIN domain-containing protein n=1 Tax=Streptomyces caeni TaxID=2307231 RepID=A0ABW4J060_9ACTN
MRRARTSRIGGASAPLWGGWPLPAKKRPDAVDAWVALAAARHSSAVVFTTDPGDIHVCLTVLAPSDVHVVAV